MPRPSPHLDRPLCQLTGPGFFFLFSLRTFLATLPSFFSANLLSANRVHKGRSPPGLPLPALFVCSLNVLRLPIAPAFSTSNLTTENFEALPPGPDASPFLDVQIFCSPSEIP